MSKLKAKMSNEAQNLKNLKIKILDFIWKSAFAALPL